MILLDFAALVLISTIGDVVGYKILVYNPRFAGSHTIFSGKIADLLADAGHEVVVYQPLLDPAIKTSGIKNKSIRILELDGNCTESFESEEKQRILWEDDSFDKVKQIMDGMYSLRVKYCTLIMDDVRNHQLLKEEKFDLGIVEVFECCGLGVFEKIGLDKYILTHSSGVFAAIAMYAGAPRVPAMTPSVFTSYTDQMSFWQRIGNFLGMFVEEIATGKLITNGPQLVIQKHFPGFDIVSKMLNAAFLFVNTDEHVDYTIPSTSKLVHIGGLSKPADVKPLDEQYSAIFESAKTGVVLISFGTNVKSSFMPQNLKDAFLSMFAEFPDINFIWKYEDESHQIAKGLKNVFTSDWLPQNEILSHPKLIGFVTHGGMNSVTESATKGVPTICIPLFADQLHNSKMLERRGSGQVILKHEITKDNLVKAIRNFVNDKTFKEKAQLLARMIKSKPTSANERILAHVNFAAQFGDTGTLISESRNLTWYQLYSLDVISFLLISLLVAIYGLFFLVRKSIRAVVSRFRRTTTLEKKKTN